MSDITISYKGNSIATMDASGTKTLLTEGKYCEDDIEVAYVKPSGGGISVDDIATNSEPSGAIVLSNTVTAIGTNAFRAKSAITSMQGAGVTTIASECFRDCSHLTDVRFPNCTSQAPSYAFTNCSRLATADIGKCSQINNNSFSGCTALRTLILRRTSVCPIGGWSNSYLRGIYDNPTASTIYVPNDLISSYQTASNWVKAYNAGVTFSKIEGSVYE